MSRWKLPALPPRQLKKAMTKTQTRVCRVLWLALPVVLFVGVKLASPALVKLAAAFPPCTFRMLTGLLCPGCGNTHAVLCLLHGDLLLSLAYNPFPVLCLLIAALFYVETLLRLFGKKITLLPRKAWVWITLGVLFAAYCVARNFFLPYLPN